MDTPSDSRMLYDHGRHAVLPQYDLGVQTIVYSWQQKANKEKGIEGAQIDLILDRRDQIINLSK